MEGEVHDLQEAVLKGNINEVISILKQGINPNLPSSSTTEYAVTPLHLAVRNSETEIVRILLQHGADPNISDVDGNTPLFQAGYVDIDIDIFNLLFSHGADGNHQNNAGENVLLNLLTECSEFGYIPCYIRIRKLIELSKDVTLVNTRGKSPIHFIDVVHPLEYKETLNKENHNCTDFLHQLIERGASPFEVDSNKMSPLYFAASVCCFSSIKLLLEKGAKFHETNIYCESAPHYLSKHPSYCGFDQSLALFIKYGFDIHQEDAYGCTLLHQMMTSEHLRTNNVKTVLEYGAEIRKTDKMGSSLLHLLLMPPEDEKKEDNDNCEQEKIEIVHFVLERGLMVNMKDKQGLTPLHYAIESGMKNTVDILLQMGADPNVKTKTGETPFHRACRYPEILEVLLEKCPHTIVNTLDKFCSTAFHWAVWYQDIAALNILLDNGIKKEALDANGRSAVDLLKFLGYEHILIQMFTPYQKYMTEGANVGEIEHILDSSDDSPSDTNDDSEPFQGIRIQYTDFENVHKQFDDRPCLCKENVFGGCPLLRVLFQSKGKLSNNEWKQHLKDHKEAYSKFVDLISNSSDMGLYYTTSENNDIACAIETVMQTLAEDVKETSPILECRVTLSGSRNEGTKIGLNDEFDYNWNLVKFNDYFVPVESLTFPKGFVRLKLKRDIDITHFKDFVGNDGFLDNVKVIRKLYFAINIACIKNDILHDTQLYRKNLLSLQEGSISNLKFQWTGTSFKDVHISVDIVPSLTPPNWVPKFINQESQLLNQLQQPNYSVVFKTADADAFKDWNRLARISLADIEASIIRNVPKSAKKGYILLKALAGSKYYPAVCNTDAEEEPLVNHISTYMIKSCFLHELERCLTTISESTSVSDLNKSSAFNESAFTWACRIVDKMLTCIQNEHMPAYFIPDVNLIFIGNQKSIENIQIFKTQCECLAELAHNALG